jgi:sugar/nucleoside kinase (ribokinase family)
MILCIGEALMEFRRSSSNGALATPGVWDGPFPSGAPAIFASVAARLGAPTALAASVGDDRFGRELLARLHRDGVQSEAIRTDPRRATAVAFVAYEPSGDRDFWFSVHDSAALEIDLAAVERVSARADWLHVSGSTVGFGGAPAMAVEAAAERILRGGGALSVDPNLRPDAPAEARDRIVRLARAARVLFPSDGELEALGLVAEELVARGALICHTRGRDGAVLQGGSVGADCVTVGVPPVEEVDATGAGDTFAAAFVTALRDGADPVSAADFGCRTAARSVAVLGAMEAPVAPLVILDNLTNDSRH